MDKNNFRIERIFLISSLAASGFLIFILAFGASFYLYPDMPIPGFGTPGNAKIKNFEKFSSEKEFKDYLAASSFQTGYYGSSGRGGMSPILNEDMPSSDTATKSTQSGTGGGEVSRISGTNVQVIGIDEPDIVKTDGKEIYFSSAQYWIKPMSPMMGQGLNLEAQEKVMRPDIMPPLPAPQSVTNAIKAFPPTDLAVDGKIDKQGDLLLDKNTLIVFSTPGYYGTAQEIVGYNVSNPKSPAKKWTLKLENNSSVVTSRLRDGKVYIITRSNINESHPCPLRPMSINDKSLDIACGEIYHPTSPVSVDTAYVALVLDPQTGKVEKTVSFIGSAASSVIYVSDSAIYATYSYNDSAVKFFSGFMNENQDLFPSWVITKIKNLENYDISEESKMSELLMALQKYSSSLSEDQRLKFQNEEQNRASDYYKRHKRDLEKTGIVRIDLEKFQVTANGTVPGRLLNNFSIDEYQDNLRVAITVGSNWGIINGMGAGESSNDVYILDKDLKISGSATDFGKTEQIYSVRFIEDKGYVVTFRQTDPFFVLDLANPKNPKIAGELKIPGFSSYLHPLDATHILGIGQESGKVRISLFDVSDKNNPVELDKYLLDEYWTEVSNNYHAFLLDSNHNAFFLPGGKGGYVFSVDGLSIDGMCKFWSEDTQSWATDDCKPQLILEKAISQNSVKRAIYINDYLYIIGEDKITVLNETNWEKVNELIIE